jgi:hypothetical protein
MMRKDGRYYESHASVVHYYCPSFFNTDVVLVSGRGHTEQILFAFSSGIVITHGFEKPPKGFPNPHALC